MARLVLHNAQQPKEVKIGNEVKHMCMCGLSKNKPFCDGSHKKTADEKPGRIYTYDENNNRVEFVNEY